MRKILMAEKTKHHISVDADIETDIEMKDSGA